MPSEHSSGGRYAWGRSGTLPDVPPALSARLRPSHDAVDAATEAEVAQFVADHVRADRPGLLAPVLARFDAATAAGESRHVAAMSCAAQMAREAVAGCYPAGEAFDALKRRFVPAAMTVVAGKEHRTEREATGELADMVAQAVAQARTVDPATKRAEIDGRTRIALEPLAPARRPGRLTDHLVTSPDLDRLPAPEPLINGVLMRHGLHFLSGRHGTYKSFIALDWAACLATGKPWQGEPAEPVRVLYIAGEGAYGMKQRRDAWVSGWQTDVSKSLTFLTKAPNLFSDSAATSELIDIVTDGGYSLVIVDTLSRVSTGADENSGKDMSVVIDRLDGIKNATAGGSVLAIAHTQKADTDTRGWSGIGDNADVLWHSKAKGSAVELTNRKQKDAPEHAPILLRPSPVLESLVMQNAAGPDPFESDDHKGGILMNLIRSHFSETGGTRLEIVAVAKDHGIPRATVYRWLNKFIERGHLDSSTPRLALTDAGRYWKPPALALIG